MWETSYWSWWIVSKRLRTVTRHGEDCLCQRTTQRAFWKVWEGEGVSGWVEGEPPPATFQNAPPPLRRVLEEFLVNKLQWIYNFTIYRKNKYSTSAFTLLKLILPDIVTVSRTSRIKPKRYGKIFSFSVDLCNPDEPRCNLTSYDWVASEVVKRRVWGIDDRKHGFSLNKVAKVTITWYAKTLNHNNCHATTTATATAKKQNFWGLFPRRSGTPGRWGKMWRVTPPGMQTRSN